MFTWLLAVCKAVFWSWASTSSSWRGRGAKLRSLTQVINPRIPSTVLYRAMVSPPSKPHCFGLLNKNIAKSHRIVLLPITTLCHTNLYFYSIFLIFEVFQRLQLFSPPVVNFTHMAWTALHGAFSMALYLLFFMFTRFTC